MNGRTQVLANRRHALQDRIAAQRAELAEASSTLEHHLRFVDRGIALVRRVTSTPLLLIAGAAIIFLVRPARLIKLAGNVVIVAAAFKRLTRDDA